MAEEKFDYQYKDPEHGKYRELFYSFDQEGNYNKKVRFHDDADKAFIEQFWDFQIDRIEEARQKVLSGEKSPLYYFMEKTLRDPMTLSSQVGISVWRVKRHFRPNVFKRLSEKTLGKYAETFEVTIEELKKLD